MTSSSWKMQCRVLALKYNVESLHDIFIMKNAMQNTCIEIQRRFFAWRLHREKYDVYSSHDVFVVKNITSLCATSVLKYNVESVREVVIVKLYDIEFCMTSSFRGQVIQHGTLGLSRPSACSWHVYCRRRAFICCHMPMYGMSARAACWDRTGEDCGATDEVSQRRDKNPKSHSVEPFQLQVTTPPPATTINRRGSN